MKKKPLFLVLLGAITAILIACGGSATSVPTTAGESPVTGETTAPPVTGAMTTGIFTDVAGFQQVPRPAKFSEAPMLAALVAAGELPPVEERLPDNPLVLQVREVGQYGGVLRRSHTGPSDANPHVGRLSHSTMQRYSGDGTGLVAATATWESNADGSVWTVHLLKGMKWSDGEPYTADDYVYQYEVLSDPELRPRTPKWIRESGDPVVQVVKIDEVTVEFRYSGPYFFFGTAIYQVSSHGPNHPHAPAHYLKQFHAKYNPDAQKNAEAAGFDTWQKYYINREDASENPDLPNTAPWLWQDTKADDVIRVVRNPYYPVVDQAGNQLPYIDEIRLQTAANPDIINLRAVQGEIDFQARHITMDNFTVLKQGEEKGGYHMYRAVDPNGSDLALSFNQTFDGPEKVFIQNIDWRIAMSHSIDRESINQITFAGRGKTRNALPAADHPYYPGPEYENKFNTYEPDKANAMLDEIMGPKDGDGFRTFPDGSRFQLTINAVNTLGSHVDSVEQICEDFQQVGVRCLPEILERSLSSQRAKANQKMASVGSAALTVDFFIYSFQEFPTRSSSTWGSQWGAWFASEGEDGVEPPEWVRHNYDIFAEATGSPPDRQAEIAREVHAALIDNVARIGIVGGTGQFSGLFVVNNDLANVPDETFAQRPGLGTPSHAYPDQFWYRSAERRGE